MPNKGDDTKATLIFAAECPKCYHANTAAEMRNHGMFGCTGCGLRFSNGRELTQGIEEGHYLIDKKETAEE